MNLITKMSFPNWHYKIDKEKYYLVLTDDIDSYLSCLYLQKKFGVQIGAFYDFTAMYENKDITKGKEPIYVDCDVVNGKAFGNHVTGIKNQQCINLNNNISEIAYYSKYAGSTLFTLFSLYDEDLSVFDDEQIKLLLCVDVWFKQYFNYRDKWDIWVSKMDLKYLSNIICQNEIEDYYNAIIDYKINSKIVIDSDGVLIFPIEYEKIKEDFGLLIKKPELKFETKVKEFSTNRSSAEYMRRFVENVFSNAMIYKGKAIYSYN